MERYKFCSYHRYPRLVLWTHQPTSLPCQLGDFISFTTHLRRITHSRNQDLLLIDSGDRHDGNGLSDITSPNGLKSTPIFIKQDYDLLTIGNHELYLWENSKQEYETVVNHFQDKYVCSNVDIRLDNGLFVPLGLKYKYFTTPIRGD